MSAQITIVIVNWNAGEQLADAVRSVISHHASLVASVVIVDNGSTDNSLTQLETLRDLPFKLVVIANTENRGFAAACNQGAKLANSDYILFLNPDTRLFDDSLTRPMAFMELPSSSKIGICGIRLVDEAGNASTSASRFPTLRVMAGSSLGLTYLFPVLFPSHLMSSSDLRESGFVDQVMGAFFLIRRKVFDLCVGFDERFFVYFEEVDLSLRAKQFGYLSYFVSEASAFHKGGGCSEQVLATRLFYSLHSRIIYARKHYSRFEFTILILLTALELPVRLIRGALIASPSTVKNTYSAYMQLAACYWRRAC